MPVLYDLNTQKGREEMAVDGDKIPSGSIVQLRVREGDDASCLNLNQTREPRVLGVNPEALADKKAFSFAKGDGWEILNEVTDGAVPAIVDMNTGMWALHVKVGDVISLGNKAKEMALVLEAQNLAEREILPEADPAAPKFQIGI